MGSPIPDRLANPPILHYSLLFYYEAFMDLHFDRPMAFGEGYIPLTAIFAYCEFWEIYGEDAEDLIMFVRAIDVEHVKDSAERTKRKQRQSQKRPKK